MEIGKPIKMFLTNFICFTKDLYNYSLQKIIREIFSSNVITQREGLSDNDVLRVGTAMCEITT